jgi:hypothetical protein
MATNSLYATEAAPPAQSADVSYASGRSILRPPRTSLNNRQPQPRGALPLPASRPQTTRTRGRPIRSRPPSLCSQPWLPSSLLWRLRHSSGTCCAEDGSVTWRWGAMGWTFREARSLCFCWAESRLGEGICGRVLVARDASKVEACNSRAFHLAGQPPFCCSFAHRHPHSAAN